ncbi:carboxypeptidase regulatory-like domain-containing protein [Paludibaculum fermentans]|uniref:TonB-dependent receptor n=1 Tax=Paludibaculum fermentans TaxID=1473598 RepID=UPI003EBEFF4A
MTKKFQRLALKTRRAVRHWGMHSRVALLSGLCCRRAIPALFLLLSLVAVRDVRAQASGRIAGTVRDGSGASVPGAEITAVNVNTGFELTRPSLTDGTYALPLLPVGQYRLQTKANGFQPFTRAGLTLTVDTTVTVDITLQVGAVSEAVEVTAQAPLLETQTGSLRGMVDQQRIVNLPLNGRDITQLVAIQAGVIPRSSSSSEGNAYSVNGTRGNGIYYMLDGGMNTDSYRNNSGLFPNPDAVQEFSIQKNNFTAEFGNATGAVVSVITKSGTNQFHGSAFEFLRNGVFNARNFFAAKRDNLKRSQFGGTLGGPIVKNKAFFFFGYQGTRLRTDPQLTRQFLPTQAMRDGNFSSLTKSVIDPLTKQPFAGNQIPVSRLSPVSQALLKYIPVPSTPTGERFTGYQGKPVEDEYTARGDYNWSNHRFSGRYFRRTFTRPFTGNTGDLASMFTSDVGRSTQPYSHWTFSDVWVISPNIINNGTFAIRGRRTFNDWASVKLPIDFAKAGVAGIAVKDPASVYVNISNYFLARPGWNYDKKDRDYHVSDTLTWMLGAHQVKIGGEYLHVSNSITNDFRTMGNFDFNGSISGDPMADYMMGEVYQFWQGGGEYKDLGGQRIGLFVQDDWRVTTNLTLNLGVRWEPFLPYKDSIGRTQCFVPGVQSTRFPNAPNGYLNAGDASCPTGGFDSYKQAFAPRFGYAWRPGGGRTVLRGGAGLFWNPQFTVLYNGFVNSAPFSPQITLNGVNFSNPYATTPNPFPGSFAPFDPPTNSSFVTPLGTFGAFSSGFKPSYQESLNFTVEHEVFNGLLARASYIGNLGRRLSYNYDTNWARYGAGATTGNIQARRPWRNFNSILVADSGSSSSYHGFQFSVERRLSKGFSIEANYTWSKSTDELSDDTTPGQSTSIAIPYDRRSGKAVSDFDNTHRFVSSWVWNLPELKGAHRVIKATLGGWQTSGIATFRSGFPYTVRSGTDRALSSIGQDYADVIGDANLAGGRSKADQIARYFNTAAFTLAAAGTFGNAPRNLLRGPKSMNFDLSAVKAIPITERLRAQLRGEFFNAFNNVNFSTPYALANSATRFGRIESAGDPRIVQIALRFEF